MRNEEKQKTQEMKKTIREKMKKQKMEIKKIIR